MPSPEDARPDDCQRVTRVELLLALALFLVGAGLRCAYPSRMAVEHFDEGVYASDCWFGHEKEHRYPNQHLYAPPLLPTLIWNIFVIFGPSNLGAMVPSLVAGCLTVPLVWWVGRSWFGPTAGLAASALAALSDPHIVFSRTALTDTLLCFWLLLAVHFVWRAMTSRRAWPTLAAGVFTALAWWTKYNGWLPLAIGVSGGGAWWVIGRWGAAKEGPGEEVGGLEGGGWEGDEPSRIPEQARRSAFRFPLSAFFRHPPTLLPSHPPLPLLRLAAIAAIAFALWSPWLVSLQDHGGYAAVAANHRGYVVGLSGWESSLLSQLRKARHLSGTASHHALAAALVIALLTDGRIRRRSTWNLFLAQCARYPARSSGCVVALVLALAYTGPVLLSGLATAAGIAWLLWFRDRPASRDESLAAWLLAAWFVGLSVSIPLYTPYSRLALPWHVATWLGGGLFVSLMLESLARRAESTGRSLVGLVREYLGKRTSWPRGAALFGGLAVCFAIIVDRESRFAPVVPGWQSRTGIRETASEVERLCRTRLDGNEPFVIYTVSEPGLLFQFLLDGVPNARPLSSLDVAEPEAPSPILKSFVVIGEEYVRSSEARRNHEPALKLADDGAPSRTSRLHYVGRLFLRGDTMPSDLVILDEPDQEPLWLGIPIFGSEKRFQPLDVLKSSVTFWRARQATVFELR